MQLRAGLVAAGAFVAGFALAPAPVFAACLLAVGTPGLLGLSSDGRTLSSANGLGSIIEVNNVTLGSVIRLSNLRLESAAGVPAGATFTGSYTATTLLGQTSGTFTNASPGQITLNLVTGLATVITLHNTAYSASGFRQGTYFMKTSVTCT
jgi:hypothetical protein